MKHTNHPKKAIRMVFALILSLSMILSLAMTTAIAADSDAANKNLKALSRHLAGIEEITDAKELDAANLTGDASVNSQSLVRWARSLLLKKGPDLTIKKEKTVTGGTYHDVTIDAAVDDGTVTLDGVTITGELIVQGGGSDSVKVKNSKVKEVKLDKDTSAGGEAPRLELTGTTVETVEVKQPAIIEANSVAGKNAIGEVKAEADVTVRGAATSIGTVTVPNVPDHAVANGVRLKVENAKVKEVKAEAPVTIETNDKASKIENVEAKANVTVEGENTKIDTITVPAGVTTAPEIKVTKGSVNTVDAKSAASVSGGENAGENAIANVEAAAPVTVDSAAVAKVTVTVNVTVTVSGSGQIEVKVDTDTAVEIQAESTEKLSVSTTATTTTNITVKQNEEVQTIHIHKWAETGRKDAACETTGTIDYRCSECNETKTEIIPAKGHTEVPIPAVAPTCTVAGSTAGKKCAVCGDTIVEPQMIDALHHDFTGSYVGDETGHWHVCPRCGVTDDKETHTYDTKNCEAAASCTACGYRKAAGTHTWNAGVVQTAAKCETAGSILYTCISCKKTTTEPIPALGHVYGKAEYEWNEETFACTATRSCTRDDCGHAESETVQGTPVELKAPTCTEEGVTSYTAAFENPAFTAQTMQVKTNKIAHALKQVAAVAATCESAGNNAYWVCTSCGQAFTDAAGTTKTNPAAQVTPALGHIYGEPDWSWTEYTSATATFACTNAGCDNKQTMNATVTNQLTKEAEGENDGIRTYTATVSFGGKIYSDTKTKTIPAPIRTVTTAEDFIAGLADTARNGVKVTDDITLTGTVEIPADKSVEIAAGKRLTLQGSLRVYGTLTNHGTISGSTVDAFGGTVVNDGTIQIGAGCMLAVEKGSTLTNTGNIFGGEGSEINIGDYINTNVTLINTVTGIDNNEAVTVPVMKAAAVFDSTKLQDALDEYDYVVPCGTNTAETNTVTLGDLTVPKGKLLILKETVDAGTDQYHNSFALNGDLTVAAGGTLVIRGSALTAASDANLTVAADGMLVSREGGSLTVANGAKSIVSGQVNLETLTVNGHVYVDYPESTEGSLNVANGLTIGTAGVLEVSGEGRLYCDVKATVTINNGGTLLATKRYMNGLNEENIFTQSEISGVTPTYTLKTLVIMENVILTGDHTVDMIVPYEGTLRVAPGGSLKYKKVHREEGFTGRIIGPTTGPDGNGYTTLTANDTTVSTYENFAAALENESVTYITVDADITVPSGDNWTQLDITKPVVIADGKKLTVAHYDGNAPKSQLIMNEVVIRDGGSLTLGKDATLTATEKRSGNNEMFYRYFGRVYVDYGGVLDVSAGTVTSGSAIYYNYGEANSKRIIVGENIPDNIAFEVHNEAQLRGAMADAKCTGGIEADTDIELTKDLSVDKYLLINDGKKLTVPAGKKLIVPAEQTLQLSGSLFVFDGTVTNHGTIYGFDTIDVVGGTLENDGTIEGMYGPNDRGEIVCTSLLVVEDGGVLNNYTTDTASTKSGTIDDTINFVDYWYTGAPTKFTTWNVLAGDTTLNIDGDSRAVIAVASSQQVQDALDCASGWGEFKRYTVVMASGTAAENEVTLSNLTVNPYQTLLLKERVDVGNTTYHNATYNLSGISFGEGAGLAIKGAPTVNIGENVNYNYLIANEGAVINGNGYVHSAEQLEAALQSGGDIYLTAMASKTDVYMDGEWSKENQYHVSTTEISKNTNLISMTNEPLAVFFDNGFTVAAGKTLKFNGLNVVAAADSTVGGRVEVCNGILVVQAKSEAGATLTIEEHGVVQVGNPNCDGKLAIFPKDGYINNKIVNNGRIERFGDIVEWDALIKSKQFTGNEPVEFINYVGFGDMLRHTIDNRPGDVRDEEIESYRKRGREWPNDSWGSENFAYLVKYGSVQPREDGCWPAWKCLRYSEAKTILVNVWKAICGNESALPDVVKLDIDNGSCLNRQQAEQLVNLFAAALRAQKDGGVVVTNDDQLTAALQNGGDIYLYPYDRKDIEPVIFEYEDGHTETVYETQYSIEANTTISEDTNLISLGGGDPMAVFFDGGFTVAEGKTLKFNGLNVVAAADSIVNGRVEAHNGELVVQTQSAALATLTISNTGVVVIGAPEEHGALAIYPKDGYINNKIVNNGRIENCGELKFDRDPNRNPRQFEGNQPMEGFVTFRDLVCELNRRYNGHVPNMEPVGDNEGKNLVNAYSADGQKLEENGDWEGIRAFAWLIKYNIISNTPASGAKLNPWHYVTKAEVKELFTAFAKKVLDRDDIDLTDIPDNDSLVCCTDNIEVEGEKGPYCTSEYRLYLDALEEIVRTLFSKNVTTEQELRAALNKPYVTEIHIKGNIELSNNIDLQPAEQNRNEWRTIFVEPGFTLTVAAGVKMDIQPNVSLCVDSGGKLIVNGNINVFGRLEGGENCITVAEGCNISYFCNANEFAWKLQEVAGEYMNVEESNISEDYKKLDGWDGENPDFTCLVAYGLQPETDGQHTWWNFGRALSYGEMKTILTNVYRDTPNNSEAALPAGVTVGDGNWPGEYDILDRGTTEELLVRFAAVLPQKENDLTGNITV